MCIASYVARVGLAPLCLVAKEMPEPPRWDISVPLTSASTGRTPPGVVTFACNGGLGGRKAEPCAERGKRILKVQAGVRCPVHVARAERDKPDPDSAVAILG